MRANDLSFLSALVIVVCGALSPSLARGTPPTMATPMAADEGPPYDIGRSIGATHRAIVNVASSIREKSNAEKTRPALTELRKAVVRNRAARLALAKKQSATAMYLALEGRRIARGTWALLKQDTPYGKDVSAEETAQPASGGKEADDATDEAEKKVPAVSELEKLLPEIDPEL